MEVNRGLCVWCKIRPGEYYFLSGALCEECVEEHSNEKEGIMESRWSFSEGTSDGFEESIAKYLALRLKRGDLLNVVFRYSA